MARCVFPTPGAPKSRTFSVWLRKPRARRGRTRTSNSLVAGRGGAGSVWVKSATRPHARGGSPPCRLADISSKSMLLHVVSQETPAKMTALVEKSPARAGPCGWGSGEAARPKAGRPEALRVRLPAAHETLQPQTVLQPCVSRDEVIDALEPIRELRKAKSSPHPASLARPGRQAGRAAQPGRTDTASCRHHRPARNSDASHDAPTLARRR